MSSRGMFYSKNSVPTREEELANAREELIFNLTEDLLLITDEELSMDQEMEVVCNRCGSGDEIGSYDWGAFDIWCFLCDMPTQKEYKEFSDK